MLYNMTRARGFLTESANGDEAYITDPETDWADGSTSTLREKRSKIRRRIREAFFDFSLLLEHYPPQEREKVFAGESARPDKEGQRAEDGEYSYDALGGMGALEEIFDPGSPLIQAAPELIDGLVDTVAFLWLGCYDARIDPEEVVAAGGERALEKAGRGRRSVTVDTVVEPDHQEHVAERARRKMAAGEELTNPEATALVRKKEVLAPNGIVFDYLRGELDQYELEPFPGEETD
jgi:hypothetical protein